MTHPPFEQVVGLATANLHPVLSFDHAHHKIKKLDLSASNTEFNASVFNDPGQFSRFINAHLENGPYKFLIGGYGEKRNMYARSSLFNDNSNVEKSLDDEPRTIHLGTDIWGAAGTSIFAALGGMVHSLAFNDHFGDYGATIILQHQLDTFNFYTLYGHLSLADIGRLRVGQFVTRGEEFAHFGRYEENGNWPPHLHFQIVVDMGDWEGDYPGVCKQSEQLKYLSNSPNPDLILNLNQYL